jgi:hypothetical protein
MSLLNPVSRAGLVARFNQIVTEEVNVQIQYTLFNKPFPEAENAWFAQPPGSSGVADLSSSALGANDPTITPGDVTSVFINATRAMTRVRNATMTVNVIATGGSPWNQSAGPKGIGYNLTVSGISNLNPSRSGVLQTLTNVGTADIVSGNLITRNGLDGTLSGNPNFGGAVLPSGFFQNLFDRWEGRSTNTVTLNTRVCHASCHGSCHGSRGRR